MVFRTASISLAHAHERAGSARSGRGRVDKVVQCAV
jgi:hypothetical protein